MRICVYMSKYFIQLYQNCSIINRQLFVPGDELGPENINAYSHYTMYEYYKSFHAYIYYKTEIGAGIFIKIRIFFIILFVCTLV